ncbi:hypothetical protein [Laceyella sacchari]|uniref:hypothetical protein n=1 Tax=Laceyella sacchari TaxID=37482 RepID=UPI0010467CC2|nr:hypothetical protein [Laceyella sacchari]
MKELIETMKWYHEWQQNARNRYLEGYYPGHQRVPNVIVLSLYGIGYFIADFIPLVLNLIDGVYWTIKRLVGFIVGILVEASIFVVLAGSVVFSVTHSIGELRKVGATEGLEYVGVLMFEVIFIGSAATLTGFLMKKKIPRGFIEWLGLGFTVIGFFVGLAFVWWANSNGMAQTVEGQMIARAVPTLVLICEGILAYKFVVENKEEATFTEIIRRNQLSIEEVKTVIEQYIQKKREGVLSEETNDQNGSDQSKKIVESVVENDHQNGTENGTGKTEKMVDEVVEKTGQTTDQIDIKNGHEFGEQMVSELVENPVQNGTEIGVENGHELVGDTIQNGDQKDTKTDHENGADLDKELVENMVDKQTNRNDEMPDMSTIKENQVEPKIEPKSYPKTNQNVGEKMVEEVVENLAENKSKKSTEVDQEIEPKLNQEINQNDNQNGSQYDTKNGNQTTIETDKETVPLEDQKTSQSEDKNDTRKKNKLVEGMADKQTKKSTEQEPIITADADPKVIQKVRRRVNRWVKKEYFGKKPPGRTKISNEFDVDDKLARQFAAELKEKYKDKVS